MRKIKFYLTVLVTALAIAIPLSFATWPAVNVTTTNLDADTDSPLAARPDLYDLATKFNQVRAHVSTFAATVLDDADAPAVRTTIGISATNTPNTPSGNIAATNVQAAINELDTEKAGLGLANVFTSGTQRISAAAPRFQLYETDAAADEKLWDLGVGNGQLLLRARTDADDAGVNVFTTNRTGTNIDSAALIADTISLTGTTINANGALAVDGLITASAGQIKFPATQLPSADANTLDDYEEGTWTPSLGGTATYSLQSGTYTKIGRMVHVTGWLDVNIIGTGSAFLVGGLTYAAGIHSACSVSAWTDAAVAATHIRGNTTSSSTAISFYGQSSATTSSQTNAVFTSGTVLKFSCSYPAQ